MQHALAKQQQQQQHKRQLVTEQPPAPFRSVYRSTDLSISDGSIPSAVEVIVVGRRKVYVLDISNKKPKRGSYSETQTTSSGTAATATQYSLIPLGPIGVDAHHDPTGVKTTRCHAVAFSSDGKLLACLNHERGRDTQIMSIFDAYTGQLLGQANTVMTQLVHVAFSSDSSMLLLSSSGGGSVHAVCIYDAFPPFERRFSMADASCIAATPDCHHIAVGRFDIVPAPSAAPLYSMFASTTLANHRLEIRDSQKTQRTIYSLSMSHKIADVAFSPNNRVLVVALAQQQLRIYNVEALLRPAGRVAGPPGLVAAIPFECVKLGGFNSTGDRFLAVNYDSSSYRERVFCFNALFPSTNPTSARVTVSRAQGVSFVPDTNDVIAIGDAALKIWTSDVSLSAEKDHRTAAGETESCVHMIGSAFGMDSDVAVSRQAMTTTTTTATHSSLICATAGLTSDEHLSGVRVYHMAEFPRLIEHPIICGADVVAVRFAFGGVQLELVNDETLRVVIPFECDDDDEVDEGG